MCLAAADHLASDGVRARVVSFPSLGAVRRAARRLPGEVFPAGVPRLAVEAGHLLRVGAVRRRHASASTTSAPRPPGRSPWTSSASPPENVATQATALLAR